MDKCIKPCPRRGLFQFDILVEYITGQVLAPHLTTRCDHNFVDFQGFCEWPKFYACCSFLFSPEPEMNYVNNIIVNLFIYLTFLHDGNILTG